MVVNQGGEEIPEDSDCKADPEPIPFEEEEGYVSTSTSATVNRFNKK